MPDPEHSQPRRRRGRPTVKPDLQKVENLAARGLTVEEIAHSLKISPATIYRRQAEIREFREAIRRGRAGLHLVGANILFEAMRGYVRLKLPDQAEQIRQISPRRSDTGGDVYFKNKGRRARRGTISGLGDDFW